MSIFEKIKSDPDLCEKTKELAITAEASFLGSIAALDCIAEGRLFSVIGRDK